MAPTRETLEIVVPVILVTVALVAAFLDLFRKWKIRVTVSIILWLITLFITSEFILRLGTIARIEERLDALSQSTRKVELIGDPQEIWERAKQVLQYKDMTVVETTSLRNPEAYEDHIESAAQLGAVITRFVCARCDQHLGELIRPPAKGSDLARRLRHVPNPSALDFLIAEAAGAPRVIIGMRPRSGGSAYQCGFQINDVQAALRLKSLIEDEYMRLSDEHMSQPAAKCMVCDEIRALQ